MMLPRKYAGPSSAVTAPAAPAPALPGLLSALRPLKRLSTNLGEEAALLRRFTYKNKNQHKGSGWWRRIVEVDRAVERVKGELGGLLREFGMSAEDREDAVSIGIEAVTRGLVRLPRSAALVDKFLSILEGCASILDQLIESRAFLPFSVVVIALVARLHTLSSVLVGELARLSAVLVRLARSNSILPQIQKALSVLPKTLRQYVVLDSLAAGPASQALSALPTPNDSPAPSGLDDDLGAVIARPVSSTKFVGAPARSPPTPVAAAVEESPPPCPPPPAATLAPRKQKRASSTSAVPNPSEPVEKVSKKRKKEVKAKGDEIDDIFS